MAVSSKQISDFLLIFRCFLLLLLLLCRPIGDVVQAGPDARQVQERARRLLHLLVVALGGLLRASVFEGQRVAGHLPRLGRGRPLLVRGYLCTFDQQQEALAHLRTLGTLSEQHVHRSGHHKGR